MADLNKIMVSIIVQHPVLPGNHVLMSLLADNKRQQAVRLDSNILTML